MANEPAWQLRLFQKTLKKKFRLKALARHLGRIGAEERGILFQVFHRAA